MPTPGRAQAREPTEGADTLAMLGARAGTLAVQQPSVGGRFVLGFLGGVPTGLYCLPLVMQGDPGPATISSAGLLLLLGATWAGRHSIAPGDLASVGARESSYREAFATAYSSTVGHRRTRAALLGWFLGVVVGLGTVLLTLSD